MSRQAVFEELAGSAPVIAPSLLKCDYGNLHRELELLEQAGAKILHLDVMDGNFVPNLSYGPMVIEAIRRLTDLPFDAHLMIADPGRYLGMFLDAGCDGITVHIEAVPEPGSLLDRIRSAGAWAGLALNPGTPVESVRPWLGRCDQVLVMSVEPGFGGQKFLPTAHSKLKKLRPLMRPGTLLSVDGGIDPTTIGPAAEAGAQLFVAGSAIFDQADYEEAMSGLLCAADGAFSRS